MRIFNLFIVILITNTLSAQMDSVSYSAGLIIAKNLKSQGFTDLDRASFLEAIEDVYTDKEIKIGMDKANENFRNHVVGAQARLHEGNKKAGQDFLDANAKKENIKITDSGLQYEVLEAATATGTKPSLLDKVKVHYHGTTIDGAVFDSSVERGEPISFALGQVIKGWQEGVQLMDVGSKYRFYIPYDLAYGERGAGESIKPYSALIFDVTLLAIE